MFNISKPKASVINGKLILSFPNAQTPTLWQMDINAAKASAIEVQRETGAQADGAHSLHLKTAKGESTRIATFAQRKQALKSLAMAAKAMETNNKVASTFKIVFMVLGSIFLIYFLWAIFQVNSQGTFTPTLNQGENPQAQQSGVPISADDFLNNR